MAIAGIFVLVGGLVLIAVIAAVIILVNESRNR